MAAEDVSLPGYRRVKELLVQRITEGRMKPGERITSERSLAKSFGISRLTVSRAISELENDGILVRRRGSGTYVADWRSVGSRVKTGRIAVVLPNLTDRPSAEMVRGVTAAFQGTGFQTIPADSSNNTEQERELITSIRKDPVDGLIIMPVDNMLNISLFHEMTYSGPPFVFVNRFLAGVEADHVVTDHHHGAFQATSWLIERGHKRIAYLTIFNSRSTVVVQRLQGYLDALTHAGIPHDPELLCPPSVYEHRTLSYKHALAYVRGLQEPATGVFAMNDTVVACALQAVADLGLKMPGDLEMAAFYDKDMPEGQDLQFMRVIQPNFDMGRLAAETLLDAIENPHAHRIRREQLRPSLAFGVSL